MFLESIIFELLGDGDLSATFPSNLRVFLCQNSQLAISREFPIIENGSKSNLIVISDRIIWNK